jgi:hypothetical protein
MTRDELRVVLVRWMPRLGLFGTGIGVVLAAAYWWQLTSSGGSPVDVRAYWAADPHALYPSGANWRETGYLYSPAFELFIGWARLLPFDVFVAIWRGLLLAILLYLAGPLTVLVLFTFPVASEVNAGNIQLVLALSIVLGFRWPATWAFVILTKLTPGIGLAWFALRRQWRHLAIAIGVTAVIAAGTAVLWPERWADYLRLIGGHPAPAVFPFYLSFWDRLPWAVGALLVGAWRGWRWPVVVAATLALPVFYTISPSMFVGLLPFMRSATGRWLRGGASPPATQPLPPQASPGAGAMLGG